MLPNLVLPPVPRALGGKVTAVKPAGEGSEVLVDRSVLLHFVPDGKPFTTNITVELGEVFVVVFGHHVLLQIVLLHLQTTDSTDRSGVEVPSMIL